MLPVACGVACPVDGTAVKFLSRENWFEPAAKRVRRLSDRYLSRSRYNSGNMPTRYTVVCDDDLARDVETLARKYELTEEEVLRQLIDVGIEHLD